MKNLHSMKSNIDENYYKYLINLYKEYYILFYDHYNVLKKV